MNDFYVYQYVRTNSSEHGPAGSPYYIGKGRRQRAYRKMAKEIPCPKDKTKIVILFRDLLDYEALAIEKDLIGAFGRIDLGTGCLRNRTDGGEGNAGAIRTAEMKAKVSAVHKGLKHSEETKARMAQIRTGAKHSEEAKARMSASRKGKKGKPMSDEAKVKISLSTKGKPKSEQFKAKISLANTGRVLSQESRDKIANSLRGKKHSEETKAKMSTTRLLKRRSYERCVESSGFGHQPVI